VVTLNCWRFGSKEKRKLFLETVNDFNPPEESIGYIESEETITIITTYKEVKKAYAEGLKNQ